MLHGGSLELREAVIGVLAEEKGHKTCFRYACCGLADQLTERDGDVFVSPKGCGHKLCPRCGRRRGGKYARRIIKWLANKDHGDLFQMVLTQVVIKGESLKAARARMAPKQKSYMRWLTRRGMTAGMTSVHIVWSPRADGWHYHVHILASLPRATMTKEELLARWVEEAGEEKVRTGEEQAAMICSAGGPIAELQEDTGDTDFWKESKGPIAKRVQYPMRDLAQGVSAWRLGGDLDQIKACARELVRDAAGWKCFRAWGDWRKECPVEEPEAEAEGEDDEKGKATPGEPKSLGPVHRVFAEARKGSETARKIFRMLEASVRNDSEFAKRLVKYCRVALGTNVTIKEGPT